MKRTVQKAQSALEYMMTYGWVLVILAIVVVALAQLGVFNSGTFSSGALPGSCQIVKLSRGVSLSGDCNGQIPKFVASFQQIVGNSSVVGPAGFQMPYGNASFSEFAWVNTVSPTTETLFSFGGNGAGNGAALQILGGHGGAVRVDFNNESVTSTLDGVNDGGWHFVGFTRMANSNEIVIYIDGSQSNETLNGSINLSVAEDFQIGRSQIGASNSSYYNGQISNLQLYNESLSGTQVDILYLEGIGGAPVSLNNIVGWWPLNGDGNDYSAQSQDGVLNNVTFISDWMGSYVAPT